MPGSLEKTMVGGQHGVVAHREPGRLVTLDAHAVADAVADEVAVARFAQDRPSRVVDGAGRCCAGPECGQRGFVAGPGRLQTAALVGGGLAHDKGAAALGVVAAHLDADADDQRVAGLDGDRPRLAVRQRAAWAGMCRSAPRPRDRS